MKNFIVSISINGVQEFKIKAKNKEEAQEKACNMIDKKGLNTVNPKNLAIEIEEIYEDK